MNATMRQLTHRVGSILAASFQRGHNQRELAAVWFHGSDHFTEDEYSRTGRVLSSD